MTPREMYMDKGRGQKGERESSVLSCKLPEVKIQVSSTLLLLNVISYSHAGTVTSRSSPPLSISGFAVRLYHVSRSSIMGQS